MFKRLRSRKTGINRILIADDDRIAVRIVSERLKSRGYDVVSAADGDQAIQKALEAKPDLILLDVLMPNLDGYATLERLRQIEETKRIPVIMLTAKSHAKDVVKATSVGAVDYVVKPFDLVVLLEKIEKVSRGLKTR